jgi:hypothetical protein
MFDQQYNGVLLLLMSMKMMPETPFFRIGFGCFMQCVDNLDANIRNVASRATKGIG